MATDEFTEFMLGRWAALVRFGYGLTGPTGRRTLRRRRQAGPGGRQRPGIDDRLRPLAVRGVDRVDAGVFDGADLANLDLGPVEVQIGARRSRAALVLVTGPVDR